MSELLPTPTDHHSQRAADERPGRMNDTMTKPSIITRCPAGACSLPDERIVEFSSSAGGGLLALRVMDGVLYLDIYRVDPNVRVRCDATIVQTEHPIGAGKSAPRNKRAAR